MSEKMTRITYRDKDGNLHHGEGLKEWGEVPAEEMIKRFRSLCQYRLQQAQNGLAVKDEDFQIDVVRGVHTERHIKTLQVAPAKAEGQ